MATRIDNKWLFKCTSTQTSSKDFININVLKLTNYMLFHVDQPKLGRIQFSLIYCQYGATKMSGFYQLPNSSPKSVTFKVYEGSELLIAEPEEFESGGTTWTLITKEKLAEFKV